MSAFDDAEGYARSLLADVFLDDEEDLIWKTAEAAAEEVLWAVDNLLADELKAPRYALPKLCVCGRTEPYKPTLVNTGLDYRYDDRHRPFCYYHGPCRCFAPGVEMEYWRGSSWPKDPRACPVHPFIGPLLSDVS